MDGIKKTIFIVSIGYSYHKTEIAFDNIQKATEMFTYLSNADLPILEEIEKKGKEAAYFDGKYVVEIKTKEVVLYKDKKSAKFSVFGDDKEEE